MRLPQTTRIKVKIGPNAHGRRVAGYYYVDGPVPQTWATTKVGGVAASGIAPDSINPAGGEPGDQNVPILPDTTAMVVRIGLDDWRAIPRQELDRVRGTKKSVDLDALNTINAADGPSMERLLRHKGFL